MAKSGKSKQKRSTGSRILSGDGLLGEIVGNAVGQLVASGIERTADRGSEADDPNEHDLAAKIVRSLASDDGQTIAQLLNSTGAGLKPLIETTRLLTKSALITDSDPDRLHLTEAGAAVAQALDSN